MPPTAFGAPQLPQIHQYLQLQEQKGVLAKQVTQLDTQMQQLKGLLVSELDGKDCATCADGEQSYPGRCVAPSDVLELYDAEKRRYYYRDRKQFVPVAFSPLLARPIQK